MPTAPGRTCGWPGCPRLATGTEHLCDVHRLARGASRRGYDARWEAIRAAVLREEPFCRLCLAAGRRTVATAVDHIKPLRAGGTHARVNLRALCATCHNRRTATDSSGFRDRRP